MESLGHLQQISNMLLICICQNQLVNLVYSSTFKIGNKGSLGIAGCRLLLPVLDFLTSFYLTTNIYENGFTSHIP